ncbi:transglycosylase [Coniosporium tulheliwenetii]|uniref:Transglycosylase n=1 Tax=Coniosporium tulheliwenetii TaxID=3383036 RepID=A0ACC2ZNI1_9PEZI|nr:transglycosylase [Cladosporium sp. JES 115]
MRLSTRTIAALASAATLFTSSAAQTFSNCNPLTQGGCPADTALGKAVNINFGSGASDSFTAEGSTISYDSNGASFTVAKPGDSPKVTSKWYIMFGKVDVWLQAAPGAGIVSSFVLMSDALDEIDWEWLGAAPDEVQTNYFGKGQTTTYNRGAFHADAGSQAGFKKYTIVWTASQIVWQIDDVTVRVLEASAAGSQYPQTPMQIKFGAWAGGDVNLNSPGTVEWARGPTDYSAGPFTMRVKAVSVADYSTGTQYQYGDSAGTWQSIVAVGGSVNPAGSSNVEAAAPAITSSSSGQPIPWAGTHQNPSTYVKPSVYPWIPEATTLSTVAASSTNYPGLPAGWTVSDTGKVIPPSAAPVIVSWPASVSAGGFETRTAYDEKGFTTLIVVAAGAPSQAKSYDDRGFLITAAPSSTSTSVALALEDANGGATAVPAEKPNGSGRVAATVGLFIASVLASVAFLL